VGLALFEGRWVAANRRLPAAFVHADPDSDAHAGAHADAWADTHAGAHADAWADTHATSHAWAADTPARNTSTHARANADADTTAAEVQPRPGQAKAGAWSSQQTLIRTSGPSQVGGATSRRVRH
jgi:hypothetical protein